MSSRRQYNMPPTEDTREALLEDTAPRTRLLPWAALACLGAANAAEAVEVLCASYLLKGLKGAPARAAVSSGVYAGMLVGGVGGGFGVKNFIMLEIPLSISFAALSRPFSMSPFFTHFFPPVSSAVALRLPLPFEVSLELASRSVELSRELDAR